MNHFLKYLNTALFFIFVMQLAEASPVIRGEKLERQTYKEKSFDENISILEKDQETGISSRYDTQTDDAVFNLGYSINPSPLKVADIQTLDLTYSFPLRSFWFSFHFAGGYYSFRAITQKNDSMSVDDEEELDISKDILVQGGLGLGMRSGFIRKLIPLRNLFTTTYAYVTGNYLNQTYTTKTYLGPGILTQFGLHMRQNPTFHYGLKFTYNLSQVTRSAESEDEKRSARSLVLSWASVGVDLALYF